MQNLIFLLAGLAIAGAAFLLYERRKPREARWHITVRHARGTQTKLILDGAQYEQFTAWLNSPDGIFVVENDTAKVTLERRYVAAVEAVKR